MLMARALPQHLISPLFVGIFLFFFFLIQIGATFISAGLNSVIFHF